MIKRKSAVSDENGRVTIDLALPVSARSADAVARRAVTMPPEAVAGYLADMIAQLEDLARATNRDMLAYLLSMASVQAAAPEARWERSNVLH